MIARPSDEDLQAYIDGQLDPVRRARVAAEIEQHPEARERAEAYAEQRRLLAEAMDAIPEGQADPRTSILAEELARRLEARRAAIAGARRHAAKGRPWRRPLLLAALGACLLGGWFGRDLYGMVAPAQAPAPVATVDRADTTLLSGRMEIPSLSFAGLRFVGGHVTDTRDGMLAYLVYETGGGERTTVTISPYPYEGSMRPIVAEHDGVKLAYWRSDRMSYVLASTMPDNHIEMVVSTITERMAPANVPTRR